MFDPDFYDRSKAPVVDRSGGFIVSFWRAGPNLLKVHVSTTSEYPQFV